jgi:hypothetical protein
MRAAAARRAAAVLDEVLDAFGRLGYDVEERRGRHEARLGSPRSRAGGGLVVALRSRGGVFGGSWGLEVSPAEPVLPSTPRGLGARGRGAVRMRGVTFRARARGDAEGEALAAALSADAGLGQALGRVHFEEVSVLPDGRPVIRHLGGSVVWVLVPPVVRPTPLPSEQGREIVAALDAFAAAGRRVARPRG